MCAKARKHLRHSITVAEKISKNPIDSIVMNVAEEILNVQLEQALGTAMAASACDVIFTLDLPIRARHVRDGSIKMIGPSESHRSA